MISHSVMRIKFVRWYTEPSEWLHDHGELALFINIPSKRGMDVYKLAVPRFPHIISLKKQPREQNYDSKNK